MAIAIAGSGDLTRYIVEELLASTHPHKVVLLVRTAKPYFSTSNPNLIQEPVDYTSVESIRSALDKHDATTLISTILTYDTNAFVSIHENLVAAALQSRNCTRFIPSEYGVNIRDYPDQPGFYWETREPIRRILRSQGEGKGKGEGKVLEWTLVCCGWILDYILPRENRYMKDIGDSFPVNLEGKRAVIPGTGREAVDFISARDLARGLVALVETQKGKWEEYTFLSGEQMSCDRLVEVVKAHYGFGDGFEVKYLSLRELVNEVRDAEDEFARIEAEYKIVIPSGSTALDWHEVRRHREKYFGQVRFRDVKEVLGGVEEGVIV